ncbi:MAG: D-tagatose-bisphosphate aldolase, class II, non-catalytic subunit [Acetobacteraceae bacterium]|nr:D-tagatose-bisphosphate aldolase, class II, non-catalytic subunit [Acetobacteraceae bacterium]
MTSVCSAHPLVIEAALMQAAESGGVALIEATCNQVNQEGGYTGLTPAAFRDLVHGIADRVSLPHDRIILGGDHLGPNPWKHLPAGQALAKAGDMIAAYAAAGFEKLHLDCSMGCAGEPASLADALTAERSAGLAGRAERATDRPTVYVIGTEVPTPGGATAALDHLQPTSPDAVLATHAVHERAFRAAGCEDAWTRVVAMVVQPGVEFGHEQVVVYDRARAASLPRTLDRLPGLVFEAHSTDYQPETALRQLVEDGFAILKVGPALTFALRETLYALDAVAAALGLELEPVAAVTERLMLARPADWRSHYAGSEGEQRILRHYSYSDRIRYYWPAPEAEAAVARLLGALGRVTIPETLISQYLPLLYGRVMDGTLRPEPRRLLIEAVRDVLRRYERAGRATTVER